MSIFNIKPSKTLYPSRDLDKKSIRLIEDLLDGDLAETSSIQVGGDEPNIDGYISLLDKEGRIIAKITVQVKHLQSEHTYYDIPTSLLGYAERIKGEVVLLLTCDTVQKIIYWKYISNSFIQECCQKVRQQKTYRYHFKDDESCHSDNVTETLEQWNHIYRQKIAAIQTEKEAILNYRKKQRAFFHSIESGFWQLKDSYIERKEVKILQNWILSNLNDLDDNIKLIIGEAGSGKSVIVKKLLESLDSQNISYLAIKADSYNTQSSYEDILRELRDAINLLSAENQKLILIIDQIDALSQYLTNDRSKLSSLLHIIKSLKANKDKDIRIIISCRRYDINYDPSLKSLVSNNNTLYVDRLTNDEVLGTLRKLEPNGLNKFDDNLIHILSLPQHLDLFCRIYSPKRDQIKFNSQIDLYKEYLQHLFLYKPKTINSEDIKDTLYKLMNRIYQEETLNPTFNQTLLNAPVISFLQSQGTIRIENNRASFLHQSFYEYLLAVYYCEQEDSFISDIKNNFQGLEKRSMIKAVLDYKRAHNENQFQKNIKDIIFSKDIRLSIKLLTLSILSTQTDIKPFERKLIKEVKDFNLDLFLYFITHISENSWFRTIRSLIRSLLPNLQQSSPEFSPLISCLNNYKFNFHNEVYRLLPLIKCSKTREELAYYLLRGHNDYQDDKVLQWYETLKEKSVFDRLQFVKAMLKTNSVLAIREIKELIIELLSDKSKSYRSEFHLLVDIVEKELSLNYPEQFIELFTEALRTLSQRSQNKYESLDYVTIKAYNGYYSSGNYAIQLRETYLNLLSEYLHNESLIKDTITLLLENNEETSYTIAFGIMRQVPQLFHQEIKNIVSNSKQLNKFLGFGDFSYYFLEMLRSWYIISDNQDALWYQDLIYNLSTPKDLSPDPKRELTRNRLLYPHLGYQKHKLISTTMPNHRLSKKMRKLKGELFRRFGRYANTEPNKEIISAYVCTGLVEQEKYDTFSKKAWYNSFVLSEHHRYNCNGKLKSIDTRVHAETFTKCVQKKAENFRPFVEAILIDSKVKTKYKLAGLKGLLEGGIKAISLFEQIKGLISDFAELNNGIDLTSLLELMIREESTIIDDVIKLILPLIQCPIERTESLNQITENNEDLISETQRLLTNSMNSVQGNALKTLILISRIESRRAQIYRLLLELNPKLSIELKLLVLHNIVYDDIHYPELFDELYIKYIEGIGILALPISVDIIQYYYYFKTGLIQAYIDEIIQDERSHKLLAQICFYGTMHQEVREDCKTKLNHILSKNKARVIAPIIELSIKHISDIAFTDLANNLIIRYSSDTRNEIQEAYQRNCNDLSSDYFELFCMFAKNWQYNKMRDVYFEISYLEKAVIDYPVEVLQFLEKRQFYRLEKNASWYMDKLLLLLVSIYKRLNEDGDIDLMNSVMDVFDTYLLKYQAPTLEAIKDI